MLLYFQLKQELPKHVYMLSPKKGRIVVDIDATVSLHRECIPFLLEAHVLTGCDTVCSYFGIGKPKVLSVLKDGK